MRHTEKTSISTCQLRHIINIVNAISIIQCLKNKIMLQIGCNLLCYLKIQIIGLAERQVQLLLIAQFMSHPNGHS